MKVQVIKTKKGAPMQAVEEYKISDDTGREWGLINLYPQVEYQEIKGFGGAFTEAAARQVLRQAACMRFLAVSFAWA